MDYSSLVSQTLDVCLGVKPKSRVWVNSWDHTLELAKAFRSGCVRRHCPTLLTVQYEDLWLRSILEGSKEQLEAVSQQGKEALAETDFYVFTMGPKNPVPWSSIPRKKRDAVSVWLDTRYDKTSYARNWAKIAKAHRVKMLAIEATLATPERARPLGLNHEEWQDVMLRGCVVDHKEIARRSKALAKVLSGKGNVHITTPSGTQLGLTLDKRPVGVSDGIVTEEKAKKAEITFLPAGAIEVSVDEEGANGKVVYAAPVRMDDVMIEDLVIHLKDGHISRYSAARGSGGLRTLSEGSGKGCRPTCLLRIRTEPRPAPRLYTR